MGGRFRLKEDIVLITVQPFSKNDFIESKITVVIYYGRKSRLEKKTIIRMRAIVPVFINYGFFQPFSSFYIADKFVIS